MCGVFGYIHWNRVKKVEESQLITAANLLTHRGPDGGGYYYDPPFFMAHRRLSIIDIQGGEQPIFSQNGRYGIVYNGEIYNFIELKKDLIKKGYTFSTNSDTEVILNGYAHWGADVCKKLIGMFAFAIHDRDQNTLFLARDRLGEKPLLYFHEDGVFSFASELKALTYVADFPLEVEKTSLSHYLSLNYVPGTQTLIKNIHKLKPGHWMFASIKGLRIESYWDPKSSKQTITTLDQGITHLEDLLEKSIQIGSRSDVPITLALSGGIDSSLVGYYAAIQGNITEAYCVDFQERGFSEYPQAKFVADKLGIRLNPVPFSSTVLEDFLNIVYHGDDPLADSSSLPVWELSKHVSKKYKVMLGGDGGDEIFGGYLTYKATLMYQKFYDVLPLAIRLICQKFSKMIPVSDGKVPFSYKLMRFLRAFDLPPEEAHYTWNGTWHPKEVAHLFPQLHQSFKLFDKRKHSSRDFLSHLQMTDLENYLPSDILTKVDRMTMAHGLETRAPLLHPDIVDFGLNLPRDLKISKQGQLKYILRCLAERKFGPSISNAKKQGFSIPIHQWLRCEAKDLLQDCLSKEALNAISFLNADFITESMQDHLSGRKQLGFELWGLMVLVTWYKQKILKPYYALSETKMVRIPLPKLRRMASN